MPALEKKSKNNDAHEVTAHFPQLAKRLESITLQRRAAPPQGAPPPAALTVGVVLSGGQAPGEFTPLPPLHQGALYGSSPTRAVLQFLFRSSKFVQVLN